MTAWGPTGSVNSSKSSEIKSQTDKARTFSRVGPTIYLMPIGVADDASTTAE